MLRFFFYGTLLDADVRRAVFLRGAEGLELRPAELHGFRRVRAREGAYPILLRANGARVRGALVEGLDRHGLLCLAHFEGPDYLPRPIALRGPAGRCRAWTLLPHNPRAGSAEPWALHHWQRRHKPQAMRRIVSWFAEPTAGTPHSIDITWRMRRWIDEQVPERD